MTEIISAVPGRAKRGRPTEIERFWAKVDKRASSGCWEWTGARSSDGYGTFSVRTSTSPGSWRSAWAHRYSWELVHGPIPPGRQIDHVCRNRACVDPTHLELVDPAENNRRGLSPSARNARKVSCPRGHQYDYTFAGKRYCKACRAAATRRWRERIARRALDSEKEPTDAEG